MKIKYLYQIPQEHGSKHVRDARRCTFEMLYENLKSQETVSFWSTSFLRGTTLDNSIVIIDECQNLNFHELDSIMTRCGQDTKIMFCGDSNQSDLQKINERTGILDFQKIIASMEEDFHD